MRLLAEGVCQAAWRSPPRMAVACGCWAVSVEMWLHMSEYLEMAEGSCPAGR